MKISPCAQSCINDWPLSDQETQHWRSQSSVAEPSLYQSILGQSVFNGYMFVHGKIIENPQSKKHALLPATAGIPIRSQSCRSWSSMVVSGDTMKTVEPIWKMGKFDWSAQKAPKFKAKTHFTLMCCFLGTRCQTHLWAWGGPTRALAGSSHIPSAMPPWCG